MVLKIKLKKLIAKGKTKEAIEELLNLAEKIKNDEFSKEIIIQSSNFETYTKTKRQGSSTSQEGNISISKINIALLDIIDQFLDQYINASTRKNQGSNLEDSTFLIKWWKWIIGFGFLISFLFGISKYVISDLLLTAETTASNTVTVLVHGKEGKDDMVLPNRGIVKLIYGDAIVSKQINAEGEATFKQISDALFKKKNAVEIIFYDPEGEAYRSANLDTSYNLVKGKYIPLEVRLYGIEMINGIVKDFRTSDLLEGARISIQGEETFSNNYGEFSLLLPEEKQQKFQTIRVFKEKYQDFKLSNVPVLKNKEIPILLKPK